MKFTHEQRKRKMLVSYLYELVPGKPKMGGTPMLKKPFGCIVALSPNNIGVSLCGPRDHFEKEDGRNRAAARAASHALRPNIPNVTILGLDGQVTQKPAMVTRACTEMSRRAHRYFK
jgi:hypothetical protein